MKMKQVLSIAALTMVGTVASAGFVQPAPVQIDFTNRIAFGDMYTARNSANAFEYIGCGVRYSPAGLIFAFCQAALGEAPEQQITCFTDNETMAQAIRSIADFSFIQFAWDADGNCTRIGNSTQSFYLPDFKAKK